MKKFILSIIVFAFISGCGNLSPRADPRLEQKLNNQNGKIGEVENLQNSVKSELGKLQSQAEITNSKLDKIQQGLINLQQNNDNHGIQILSGPGGLTLGLLTVIGLVFVCFYYRSNSKMHEKTANILAEKIVSQGNPQLENAVFEAVLHTDVAENMLNLIKKQKHTFKNN